MVAKAAQIVFDAQSMNWSADPEINLLFLRAQENFANDMLRSRGHVFLNEIHDMLGVPRTTQGQLEGWMYEDRESHISFGVWDKQIDNDSIELELNIDGVIYDKL